jgi:protein TonB
MKGRRAPDFALAATAALALHAGVFGMTRLAPVPDKPHPPEVVMVALLLPPPRPVAASPAPLSPPALHLHAPQLALPRIPVKATAPPSAAPTAVSVMAAVASAPASETAAKGPPAAAATDGADPMAAYLALVRDRIQARLVYPPAARRLHLTGQVTISLSIAANGRLDIADMTVVGSGADDILAAAAITTLKELATVPPPPRGPIRLLVPVVFQSPS